MSMVEVFATQNFATMIAGGIVSATAGKPVLVPSDVADDLVKGGMATRKAPAAPENKAAGTGRIVSDAVPDPEDATALEKATTDDAESGRSHVDPSVIAERERLARLDKEERAGREATDADDVVTAQQGEHTDPSKDGQAAKGSLTTGEQDVSKGSKPASKPVKTGQTTAHKKPRATGKGKVSKTGGMDPDRDDPDRKEPDRSTVGDKAPTVEPTGPQRDEPVAKDPSPGTVKEPSADGGELGKGK
jgi:hypothetical protein